MSNQLQAVPEQGSFGAAAQFEHAQRVAKMLSSSNLVPKDFQGNIQNTMIALEISNRIGASPLMVMQNLYIIHGKPSWSSSFIIAAINSSNKFSPLRFDITGEGDDYGCVAWCIEKGTEQRLESPRVSIGMARKEGWLTKTGSKWVTMPDLMLRYRAASFFGRLYAPEILMGMYSVEEIVDIKPEKVNKEQERLGLLISDCSTIDELSSIKEHLKDADADLQEVYETKLSQLQINDDEIQ
jgi:hypothetical protein